MFLRILKQKNKTTISYKMAVVESYREEGKVRHRVLLYIGTFPEKFRHRLESHRLFYERVDRKFAESNFKPFEKENIRQKIFELFPEIKETREADRECRLRRRDRKVQNPLDSSTVLKR